VSDRLHEPINKLVERIRRDTGARVPDVDPGGPGPMARLLLVLKTPGAQGALLTGLLSPTKNEDATARNLRKFMDIADLEEDICLFWNAVPWDIGERRSVTNGELERGAEYLSTLAGMMPEIGVVVAMGRDAQRACELAGVNAIRTCNPSTQGLYGGGVDRSLQFRAALEIAARLAQWPGTLTALRGDRF
jgi:uracil-DNA glycosylase